MAKPTYTSTFSSKVKTLYPEDRDKYIAQASLAQLSNYLPDVDLEKNSDVLPVVFDAFVANRVNKNDDIVDSKTAVALAPLFKQKFINVEHDRDRVIGVILDYKFTEFGSDKPLTEEEALGMDKPFNVALCGLIWRSVAPGLSEYIEEASDPTSSEYLKVSASWEIGFTEFALALLKNGAKNLEDGSVINPDEEEYEKQKVHLRLHGGDGMLDSETFIYRKIQGEELWGLGVGFTENPAADVKGVATEKSDLTEKEESEAKNSIDEEGLGEKKAEKDEKTTISDTKASKNTVKKNRKVMKLKSWKDLTDENIQEVAASDIQELIQKGIKDACADHQEKLDEKEQTAKTAQETAEAAQKEAKEAAESLAEVKKQLEAIEAEKEAAVAQANFDQRMTELSKAYDLDEDLNKVIAGQIKGLDAEAYAKWQEDAKVFLKPHDKEAKAKKVELDEAIENGKKDEASATATASTQTEEPTLAERFQKAFLKKNK